MLQAVDQELGTTRGADEYVDRNSENRVSAETLCCLFENNNFHIPYSEEIPNRFSFGGTRVSITKTKEECSTIGRYAKSGSRSPTVYKTLGRTSRPSCSTGANEKRN